jgi:hypothetical protein
MISSNVASLNAGRDVAVGGVKNDFAHVDLRSGGIAGDAELG